MRSIQLYATGSSTASAVAQVTIPAAGRIKGIQAAVSFDQSADNSISAVELSKASASQIGTNGALDSFLEIRQEYNLTTSGASATGVNAYFPVDVPVRQGEIIYLHALATTTTFYANFIIWYD